MGAKSAVKLRKRGIAYKCQDCGRKLMTADALVAHQRTAHNIISRRRGRPAESPKPIKLDKVFIKEKIQSEIPTRSERMQTTETTDDTKMKKNTVEFECPKCFKKFPNYFPALKHIQKYHCVNRQNMVVPRNHPNLINPIRIEQCVKCLRKVRSIETHVCDQAFDAPKKFDSVRLCICAACEEWFPSVSAFDLHVVNTHSDHVESMFFPTSLEFVKWKTEMEQQTNVSYTTLDQIGSKRYYHCNNNSEHNNRSNKNHSCPSIIVVQEFPKGIQVHFYHKHYNHRATEYRKVSLKYKKYSISSFLQQAQEYSSLLQLKPDEDDLYMQFKTLMEGIVVDAAKINIATLKIILGKALEITSILTNYDEEFEDEPMSNPNQIMSDDQITKALEEPLAKRKVIVNPNTTTTPNNTTNLVAVKRKHTVELPVVKLMRTENILQVKRKSIDVDPLQVKRKNTEVQDPIQVKRKNTEVQDPIQVKRKNTEVQDPLQVKRKNTEVQDPLQVKRKNTEVQDPIQVKRKNTEVQDPLQVKRKNTEVQDPLQVKRKNTEVQTDISDAQEIDACPKIVNAFSLADSVKHCKPVGKSLAKKLDDAPKIGTDDENKLQVNGEPSSFNDSYKDFVVKNFPSMESVASRTRSKPTFKTRIGQFKPTEHKIDVKTKYVPVSPPVNNKTKPVTITNHIVKNTRSFIRNDSETADLVQVTGKTVDEKTKYVPDSPQVNNKTKPVTITNQIVKNTRSLIRNDSETTEPVQISGKTVDEKTKSVSFSPKIANDPKIRNAKERTEISTKIVGDKTNVLPKIDVKIGTDLKESPNSRGKTQVADVTPTAKMVSRVNSRASFDKPKVDIEYEVKERDDDCNILILKI